MKIQQVITKGESEVLEFKGIVDMQKGVAG